LKELKEAGLLDKWGRDYEPKKVDCTAYNKKRNENNPRTRLSLLGHLILGSYPFLLETAVRTATQTSSDEYRQNPKQTH